MHRPTLGLDRAGITVAGDTHLLPTLRGHDSQYNTACRNFQQLGQLQKEQECEWKYFKDSKEQYLRHARLATAMSGIVQTERLHRKYSNVCSVHREELESFRLAIGRNVLRQPVPLSSPAAPLQALDDALARTRLPGAALDMHNMITALQHEEREEGANRNQDVIDRKVANKKRLLDEKEVSAYRKVLIAEHLVRRRDEENMRALVANLKHKEGQMASAHYKQRIAPYFPLVKSRAFSSAQKRMATRGTQLAKTLNKGHFYVPSLCGLYGHLLEVD